QRHGLEAGPPRGVRAGGLVGWPGSRGGRDEAVAAGEEVVDPPGVDRGEGDGQPARTVDLRQERGGHDRRLAHPTPPARRFEVTGAPDGRTGHTSSRTAGAAGGGADVLSPP